MATRSYLYTCRFSLNLTTVCARNYCNLPLNGEAPPDSHSIKTICKIMMSCPQLGVEPHLNQTCIKLSPGLVEDILKRFHNAGMQAYRFFQWAGKQPHYSHTVRAYHTIIASLAKIRQYQIMWDLVNDMRSKGILNVETFCVIMRSYARAHKLEEAIYAFNVMETYGLPPNLPAFNSLLSALCKSKNVRKAQEIFDRMKEQFVPDSKTYTILLEGWGKDPNLPKARQIFNHMIHNGCYPDIVTYGIMVDVLCKGGRVDEALGVVRDMDAQGACTPTSFIFSVLIHTYGIDNRIADAVDTFLEMERNGVTPDIAVYNALIGAFCKVNRLKNAFRVLNEMNHRGVVPNARTCNIIMSSLIGRGDTDEAFRVFRRMIKICEPDADTYTMLIKMFCQSNELEMALKVWRYMSFRQFVPSMHTFSVLINGLCDKEKVSEACVFLEEMIEKGIRPSGPTFGRLRQLLIKQKREDVLQFLVHKMNLLIKEPLFD
ncbi:hypothetical protein Sjap_009625 [Stephania japonica]|uniref:Pentatricopeptide repeat-containing protein n=1 Tax=Stephania japonica TaxID=461633 RepID=A0AAP0JA62_9MAGN